MRKGFWLGVTAGGMAFLALSYVLHCGYGLGPWACQKGDPRRI